MLQSLAVSLTIPIAASLLPGTAQPTEKPALQLAISKYQYCRQAPCRYPTEAAYRRTTAGPIDGTDNPSRFVAATPGQTITWTYKDTADGGLESCDFYGTPPYPSDPTLACTGHSVRLEDGTTQGTEIGFLPAREGPGTISWTVPPDAKPGSLIRYFCNVRDQYMPGGLPHWLVGMTGGLTVLPS